MRKSPRSRRKSELSELIERSDQIIEQTNQLIFGEARLSAADLIDANERLAEEARQAIDKRNERKNENFSSHEA